MKGLPEMRGRKLMGSSLLIGAFALIVSIAQPALAAGRGEAGAASFEDDIRALSGDDAGAKGLAWIHIDKAGAAAFPALVKELKNADRETRIQILRFLSNFDVNHPAPVPSAEAVADLARYCRSEQEPAMRSTVATVLSKLGGRESLARSWRSSRVRIRTPGFATRQRWASRVSRRRRSASSEARQAIRTPA